jgi:hypothetical protein
MNSNRNCKCFRHDHQSVISLALVRYNFSTPDIRLLMRQVLGHTVSARTIKRQVRATGCRLKRGRPPSSPRVHKGEMNRLIELTSNCAGTFNGNALQLLQEIHVQFGLTPRQYFKWVAKAVRRGKCMMRKCLLCGELFPSGDSGERNCRACQGNRRRFLSEERRSAFV